MKQKKIIFTFEVIKLQGRTSHITFTKERSFEILPVGTIYQPGGKDHSLQGTVRQYSYDETKNELTMKIEANKQLHINDIEKIEKAMEGYDYVKKH